MATTKKNYQLQVPNCTYHFDTKQTKSTHGPKLRKSQTKLMEQMVGLQWNDCRPPYTTTRIVLALHFIKCRFVWLRFIFYFNFPFSFLFCLSICLACTSSHQPFKTLDFFLFFFCKWRNQLETNLPGINRKQKKKRHSISVGLEKIFFL